MPKKRRCRINSSVTGRVSASNGNPNGKGAENWPRYATRTDAMLSFGKPIKVQTTARQYHQCAFWEALAGPEGMENWR